MFTRWLPMYPMVGDIHDSCANDGYQCLSGFILMPNRAPSYALLYMLPVFSYAGNLKLPPQLIKGDISQENKMK